MAVAAEALSAIPSQPDTRPSAHSQNINCVWLFVKKSCWSISLTVFSLPVLYSMCLLATPYILFLKFYYFLTISQIFLLVYICVTVQNLGFHYISLL